LVDPTGVTKCRYEIYEYPTGFSVPGGWTADAAGVYFYVSSGGPAPAFTLPSSTTWGKFLTRATANDGKRFGSGGKLVAAPDLIDSRTVLEIPSPSGLPDVAFLEGFQFDSQRGWIGELKQWLRALEAGTIGGSAAAQATVRVATTANITLSGAQTIDGVSAVANDRVLVKNQSTGSENGIYVCASGAWTRASDFDSSSDAVPMKLVGVSEGATNGNKVFALTTDAPITLGSTALTFSDITGSGSPTLAATLAVGNTSGANDIVMSDGQAVRLGSTNPASTGDLRLRSNRAIRWRNAGNSANVGIILDGSDRLTIGEGGGADLIYNAAATHFLQVVGSTVGTLAKPSTSLEFRAHGDNATGGLLLSVTAPTTAVAGRNVGVVGGAGGTGNQNGGNAFLKSGAKTGSGTDGLAGIQDATGAWRLQLTAAKDLTYDAATAHIFSVASAVTAFIDNSGFVGRYSWAADAVSAGIFTMTAPSAGNGREVGLIGGSAGPGNQNGGDCYIGPGAKTGSGVDGSAGIADASGAFRILLTPSRELEYDAATKHTWKIAASTWATLSQSSGSLSLNANGDQNTGTFSISVTAPTTGAAGRSVAVIGGTGGTGNQNGGDAYLKQGAKTGSGTAGAVGIKDSGGVYRLKMESDTSWTFDANAVGGYVFKCFGTATYTLLSDSFTTANVYFQLGDVSEPATPAGAARMWSQSGALKAKGSSGTITTLAPAEPHCPKCGLDFAKEWEHPEKGKKLSLCLWCATAPGGPLEGYVIERIDRKAA
jgi:hypothetical protein